MTNEQLIKTYNQTLDERYISSLYDKNEKLLWYIAHKFNCDIDETYIGFTKAIQKFDETKGKFTTLLYATCKNEILMNRRKRQIDTISIDTPTNDNLTIGDMLEDTFDLAQKLEDKYILDSVIKELEPFEQIVIEDSFYNDLTLNEISNKYKTTFRVVQRVRQKALKKMISMIRGL